MKRASDKSLTSLAGAQRRHIGSSPNAANYDPDLWADEFAFLNKSGESDIRSISSSTTRPTSQVIPRGRLAQASEAADARCMGTIRSIL